MKENNKYSVVLDKNVYQRVVDIVKSANFHDNKLSDDNKISLVVNNIINEHYKNYKINNLFF